jgi:hypothetical protein
MPIRNCPIPRYPEIDPCLGLPIKIINPTTNRFIKTFGIVDTGASECAIPSFIAELLGYDVNSGEMRIINTGNGQAHAYRHTISMTIHHPIDPENNIIFTINNILIDCMPNLNMVLLGVNGFLSNFVLKIDYPNRIFSITH